MIIPNAYLMLWKVQNGKTCDIILTFESNLTRLDSSADRASQDAFIAHCRAFAGRGQDDTFATLMIKAASKFGQVLAAKEAIGLLRSNSSIADVLQIIGQAANKLSIEDLEPA